MITIFCSICCS